MPLILPLSRLAGACASELSRIRCEWPDGILLEDAAVERAVAMGLDIDWAAEKLLDISPLAEYNKVRDTALVEYDKICDTAWEEYDPVHDVSWEEYYKVRDPALTKCRRMCAKELLRLLLIQEKT